MKLPTGMTINGKKFMFRFSHKGQKFRITTKLLAIPENLKKATKALTSIKLDLERNQFFIVNYKNILTNTSTIEHLDSHYVRNKLNILLGDLLEEQLSRYKLAVSNDKLSYSSLVNYDGIINGHLIPYFKNIQLSDLNISDIESFITTLSLSKKRVSMILSPLRTILRRAKKHGTILVNPLDNLSFDDINEFLIDSNYVIEPFNTQEKELIISTANGQLRNIIQFAFWTGMRVGEIFALTWGDIDFKTETINISKSKSLGRIKTTKTKAGIREVELTPLALNALINQKEFTSQLSSNVIFHNPYTNKPWSKPDVFRRHWLKILDECRVKYRNPHQMRHTFISYMLMVGNKPEVLYKMVGHIDTSMIYRIYGKFINGEKKGKQLVV